MITHGLSASIKEKGSLSTFNVPRRFHLPIALLRLLCIIPALIGVYNNITTPFTNDDYSGLFQHKSSPLTHKVALLWCILAGYWSWVLTTSMLRRWLYHYEISSTIVRLITLNVINWSVSAYLSSRYGIDQPIWKWMTICMILFVSNIIKIRFASRPKYHTRTEEMEQPYLNYKSTFVRVLIFPLTVVIFITMFASLYQIGQMRRVSGELLAQRTVMPIKERHPELADAHVRVMVFVLSAWTAKSLEKRKVFRETTLKLMPEDNEHISYFYRFIIGQPPNEKVKMTMGPLIEQEIDAYGDILLLPCSDLYEDLSKKVYAAFEWANQYDFDYFVKTDDDIFVRWDTISKEMELAGRTQRYWRGLAYW
ncbi:uncharacterized protein BX663DRAFT_288986 [Cokeromyces recurvatus]|uniref:uncharacterized protein n=1 Tax=Cokeromyces recurvatus TaxID=90255 RepID=UPI002220177A|nr:uncharacterized protein BX663DRAFT_288986 [Cokeromyces recurvatus]KAI7905645.1 hypothetical protein BX663DRAFT_288986 [Cokeromyces recurvatus]